MSDPQVVVIGAGQAGVATAVALKDAGLSARILESANQVGASWRNRYDRLRLNTCRWFSHLPGRRFPAGTPMFPTREQVIAHLEQHVREAGVDLAVGVHVERIDREDGRWVARTSHGDVRAPQVVVATGYEQQPVIPPWPGRSDFTGQLLHSSEYRNPAPFRGRRVLVVGSGCSGMEIAYDAAVGGAEKVWLAVRTPPNIVLREGPAGLPGDLIALTLLHLPVGIADAIARFGRRMDLGDLTEYGLPVPEEGVFARLRRLGVAPAIVDKEVIQAIREGRIAIVRGVASLATRAVILDDGARIEPDAVICATGFRRALQPLVGHLGVLGEHGMPRALGAEPASQGLRFIGYVSRPGALGYMGKEARQAARAIARELA